MRYAIVTRPDKISWQYEAIIKQRLNESDFVYDADAPELVITIGGDGTLLEAVKIYQHIISEPLFVGIHSGSLGFYTDWRLDEVDVFLDAVIANKYEIEEFPLLQTKAISDDEEITVLALNEITISDSYKTLVLNVCIDDVRFETFRGTGVCLSTPSGSTAYNKSLGGALVHPTIRTFQLTEMASLNNKVYRTIGAPILLAENQEVKLKFVEVDNKAVLTNDHYSLSGDSFQGNKIKELQVRVAKESIRFARYRSLRFWDRVQNAFL